jgi:hypothetical protein
MTRVPPPAVKTVKDAAHTCDLHLGFHGRVIHINKSEHYDADRERSTSALSEEDVTVVISLKDLSTMLVSEFNEGVKA